MVSTPTKRPPLTPRHWPGWLGVSFLWLLGKTPFWFGRFLSGPLGSLMSGLMKSRRKVAERNMERCFPELDDKQRQALVDGCFKSLGRMLFEVTWSWSASTRRIRKMGEIDGFENMGKARENGRGVLVITGHITCLEIGGRYLGLKVPECMGIYRPLKSPVLEWYQNRSRKRYTEGTISKRDMRSAIRFLRNGGVLWYAPDQDFGPKQSTFAPFFGIQTATLDATVKLVELTNCAVVPMFPMFDASSGMYRVTFYPALENFPGGDMVQDLTRVNAQLEQQIRQAPEQYWWIHRRFKTRPEGEPPFYG
mgnify:CR=1 FL=1